jgi:hypothetical protein
MKLLLSLFLILSLTGCNAGEPDIFIIPENFKGGILIIFDQKRGMPAEYHGKSRVYRIPEGGLLKTQFLIDKEWKKLPRFYYGSISPANSVQFFYDSKQLPKNETIAYGGSSGTANKDLAGKNMIHFAAYYIGNSTEIDTAYQRLEEIDIASLAE